MPIDHYATVLADGIVAALPSWVERSVRARLEQASPEAVARAREAGLHAAAELGPSVRSLLEADIDEQWTTPLALVRSAVRYPTEVLRAEGAAPVSRDGFRAERFPDDPYDLTPATLADLDPSLAEAGIAWGAARAFEHKQRHGGSR